MNVDNMAGHSSDHTNQIDSINDKVSMLISQNASIMEIKTALSNEMININYQNVNGDTFLHLSVKNKNIDIIGLLIKEKANINICNKSGKTPLKIAEECVELDVKKQIIELLSSSSSTNVSHLQLNCPICYEVFRPRMISIASKCGHVYCRKCFMNMGPNCAYCRKDLEKPTADSDSTE